MKKSHLIALLAVVAGVVVIFSAILAPFAMFFGSMLIYEFNGNNAKIEIDSYRLCQDTDGNCYEPFVIDVPVEYFQNAGGRDE